jgi:hybrid cluster-associated redox disulfide protein
MTEFTEDTLIKDLIAASPTAATVLERNGLGCASCLAAGLDTVASAASAHELDAAALLREINHHTGIESGRET